MKSLVSLQDSKWIQKDGRREGNIIDVGNSIEPVSFQSVEVILDCGVKFGE
jgi:hypothetical protein